MSDSNVGTAETAGTTSNSENGQRWPCSNCHCTVSAQDEERCPACHGIQVKIPPDSPTARIFLERLSPATVTPRIERSVRVALSEREALAVSLTAELEEDDDDELSASVESPEHDGVSFEDDADALRPIDPVAVTLAAVHSPTQGNQKVDGGAVGGVKAALIIKEAATNIGSPTKSKRKSECALACTMETKKPKVQTAAE